MNEWQTMVSLALGLGLSAACGFRVFVPFLGLGLAARAGAVSLAPDFAWIASTPAVAAFAAATVLEVLAYMIPWLDHALDVLATPAAVVAGALVTAAVFADVPPLARWGAALMLGGGTAGLVQGTTVLARLKSTALTGGIANPAFAVAETGGSVVTAAISLLLPAVLLLVAVVLGIGLLWVARRALIRRSGSAPPVPPNPPAVPAARR